MMPLAHTGQHTTRMRVTSPILYLLKALVGLTLIFAIGASDKAQAFETGTAADLPAQPQAGAAFWTQVPDFYIYCRLASRTELTGSYTRSIAVLGSDTTVPMEPMIASGGFISLVGYIAEATVNSTVSSELGVLTTLSDSVFLGQANLKEPKILGLVRTGQTFRIIDSVKGPEGGEPALFHRIELRGRLVSPSFNMCSARANPL